MPELPDVEVYREALAAGVAGAPLQRIVYAENECDDCARCQTGGTVLADRALPRLRGKSFPRSLDGA
jgi:formamidopyrimidine-DNA glycosylase